MENWGAPDSLRAVSVPLFREAASLLMAVLPPPHILAMGPMGQPLRTTFRPCATLRWSSGTLGA